MNGADALLAEAVSRYQYWLKSTNSRRLAASLANQQIGLKLAVKEYEALLKMATKIDL